MFKVSHKDVGIFWGLVGAHGYVADLKIQIVSKSEVVVGEDKVTELCNQVCSAIIRDGIPDNL